MEVGGGFFKFGAPFALLDFEVILRDPKRGPSFTSLDLPRTRLIKIVSSSFGFHPCFGGPCIKDPERFGCYGQSRA